MEESRLHETKQIFGHDLGTSIRIDVSPERDVTQRTKKRFDQLVVAGNTRPYDVVAIIAATLQLPPTRRTDRPGLLRRADRSALHTLRATAQALHGHLVGHDELDEQVQWSIGEHLEQASSLSCRPRVAIENKPCVDIMETLLVEDIDQRVRYQLTGSHEAASTQAEWSCAVDLVAQHVPARDVLKTEPGGKLPGLRALPDPGGPTITIRGTATGSETRSHARALDGGDNITPQRLPRLALRLRSEGSQQ